MPNTKGGKHYKKGKKSRLELNDLSGKLRLAETGEVYGYVLKKPGGSRLDLYCSDGENRQGVIPGKFFKRVWIGVGDVVLCQLEDINNQPKCYIIYKYTDKEKNQLRSKGETNFQEETHDTDDINIEFGDSSDEEPNKKETNNLYNDNPKDVEITLDDL